MTLAFFKYGLPVLLGYTLFVGISGRLNPFSRPDYKAERVSWQLGIWTGMAIGLILAAALHLAYSTPTNSLSELLAPAAVLLALLTAPALLWFAFQSIRRSSTDVSTDNIDSTVNADDSTATLTDEIPTLQIKSASSIDTAHVSTSMATSDITSASDASDVDAAISAADVTSSSTTLQERLETESNRRREVEKHLRITRKALSTLEADTRHFSIDKADSLIALEEKLAESIQAATNSEFKALKEKTRRVEVEQKAARMKQKMVKAKQEIRRGAAARARALSTANKSIAFARQCVEIRTRLEAELKDSQIEIDNRQKTITSLIRALEKQKRKTNDDVVLMAKQMILQEKQVNARRSLEDVARSVENKLSTRLIKKVAKARPLASDANPGKAG